MCGIAVLTSSGEFLEGQDILWFVDNESACSALIRGQSREGDVHVIAQTTSLLLRRKKCRAWFEWIDSDANLADGLSRLGVGDPWTLLQGWQLEVYELPEWCCKPQSVQTLWMSLP